MRTLLVFSLLGLSACSSEESEQAKKLAAARAAQQARVDYLNSPAGQAETYKKLSQHTKDLKDGYKSMRMP